MAILTQCPNGHRFKVKDHLAGMTGRCPTCGARFRVEAGADLPLARIVQLDPAVVATLPRARPIGATAEMPAAETAGAAEPAVFAEPGGLAEVVAQEQPLDVGPGPDGGVAAGLHEVIAERPDLTWCIAFPGGDPTEPLDAPTMQAWLDGGHATGTEVVWRADWPEWRPVREVFPGIFGDDFRF